jgi:hypothetical protein
MRLNPSCGKSYALRGAQEASGRALAVNGGASEGVRAHQSKMSGTSGGVRRVADPVDGVWRRGECAIDAIDGASIGTVRAYDRPGGTSVVIVGASHGV